MVPLKTLIKPFDELTLDELYGLLKLRCDVFVVEQACPYPELDNRDQTAHHLMIWEGDALIAGLRILPAGSAFPAVSIGRVVVHPAHRGSGVARIMMETGIAHACEAFGAGEIQISAQAHLRGFYGSLGFVAEGDTYLEDGIPHVDMRYKKED